MAVSTVADLADQVSAVLALAGSVRQAWVLVGDFPADFPDCNPVGCPARRADGYIQAASRGYTEADTRSADNANCHDSPAGWHTPPVADDTRLPPDDKDSPNLPNKRGCNKHAARPNSIPTRPIPRAGYRQSAPQFQSPLRK
jgi:hypothetical protein